MNKKMMADAVALHQAGRHEDAKRKYESLAVQFPRDPDLLHFRGLLASHMGDQTEAIRLIGLAIEAKPEIPDYHQNLAISHQRAGNSKAAAIAYNQQGNLLQKTRRLAEAALAFERSLVADPSYYLAAINYTGALIEAGKSDEAIEVLRKVKRYAQTPQEKSYIACNMGICLFNTGETDQAHKYFDEAIKLYPGNTEAHRNRSTMVLGRGNLRDGFAEYEWRCVEGMHYMEMKPGLSPRVWQGELPQQLGGNLLVLGEQGLGDTIHFSRYVKLLADQGHRVLFEVQPALYTLFAEGWAEDERIRVIQRQPNGRIFNNLPFAALISVMSLPTRFGTTLETIPGATPYLEAAPKRVAQWDSVIPANGRLNVGLVWRGSIKTPHDQKRSMPGEFLEPLLARGNINFYSLQKDAAAKHRFASSNISRLDELLRDFADTAGAIKHLDLLISVDSSVAHLAGALDCPVWIAMPRMLDWRWMRDREDTPWYPKTRLFRQKKPDDWASVIAEIGRHLDRMVASRQAA